MELRHLHALLAVADELHFGRAAARLSITQPALSQQVAQLEKLVEARLFDRHPRIALTAAGQLLADRARQIVDRVAEAESEVRALGSQSRQRIRLGYLEYFNLAFLAPLMRKLREHDPPIVVEARNLYPREVLAGLRDRTLEVGFVHLPVHDPDLSTRTLLEGTWAFVLPKSHRLAKRAAINLAELADEPIIFFDRSINPPMHAYLLGRFADAKVVPRIVYATTQPQVGVDLVREGVGIYLVGSYVVRALPKELVMRPVAELPPLAVAAAWRGDGRTPAVAAFLAALPTAR